MLPELRALSWSINCYNCYTEQQPGHRHAAKGCPGSWPVKNRHRARVFFLPFLFFDSSEDISFHEPVESSFSHQVLLLNDTARGSATLSHIKSPRCQIKSREWVKKQGFLILMKEQCWDQRLRKLTIRGRKTLIMIVSAGSLQCPHT